MKRPRRSDLLGRTLVENALIFAVVGIFIASVLPAFFRAIRVSRLDEPPRMLHAIAERAETYYSRLHPGCLPGRVGPWPPTPLAERAEVDWEAALEEQPGWAELRPAESDSLAFSYSFVPRTAGCEIVAEPGVPLFTVIAEGDLDADGERSRFVLDVGRAEEGDADELVPLGALRVDDRVE